MGDPVIESRFTLIGIMFSIALNIIALSFLPLFIFRMRKKLSAHFLINLSSAVVCVISSIPWNLQLMVGWNAEDSKYNKLLMFWFALLYYGFLLPASLSVTFLTIDRSLTVLTTKYTSHRRNQLAVLNVMCQILLCLVFVITQYYYADIPNFGDYDTCFKYICVNPKGTSFILYKVVLGGTNTVLGLAFNVYFYFYNKERKKRFENYTQSSSNIVGVYVILIEFFFNFIPQLLSYITVDTPYHVMRNTGPSATYFFALEVFCLTMVNIKFVGNPWKGKLTTDMLSSTRPVKVSTVKHLSHLSH